MHKVLSGYVERQEVPGLIALVTHHHDVQVEALGTMAFNHTFESGGGGLVSTIDDYFAFCRMMLNKGRHGREQILSAPQSS